MFAAKGFFCLFSLAPTAVTMSSTLSCWYETSPAPRCPFTRFSGGFLADVSKNIIPWALAKLIACSWLTWPSVVLGSRRSLLLPTRNLRGERSEERDKRWFTEQTFDWFDQWLHTGSRQLPGDFLSHWVLPALFYPGNQATETGGVGDIINEEHGVDVSIVLLHHGLTKALLSRCVPELELRARETK